MASVEALECNGVSRNGASYCNGGHIPAGKFDFQGSENVEDEIIHDMDMFLEDIDDRLTISRMVSDSVIKGIVTAISQDAAEVVAAKEREVAGLNKVLRSRQCGCGTFSESEIRGEVEGSIFDTFVGGLREEHEMRLLNVDNVLAFIDRCKDISSLRHELESIQKTLDSLEAGHLSPQGPLDADIFHRTVFSSQELHSGSLWDVNGGSEESKTSIPAKLSHLSKTDLFHYFRNDITQMKRDHESTVQRLTEEYYRLKRECLKHKERGHFVARKEKDFESLTKKMSEVITRLDDILIQNEKLSEFCNHSRDTLNNLLSENCRLRELLNGKKLEASYLSLQVSDGTEKLAQHVIDEENLRILVDGLTDSLEDARLETLISEDIYNCILGGLVAEEKSDNGDSDLKSIIMQEIIGTVYEEAFHEVIAANESNHEETSNLMSNLMQQVYDIVFQEVVVDMSMELIDLKNKCLKDKESLVYLETKVSESDKDLRIEIEENGKLKHQVLMLENLVEDKDISLFKVTEELHKLMDLRKQQDNVVASRDQELVLLKEKLEESQNCVDLYMAEVGKLNDTVLVFESRLRKSDKEKSRIISAFEQQQNEMEFVKANTGEHKKQLEFFCRVIDGLSKSIADLERRTNEKIGWHGSRLENSAFQLRSLAPKVNILRRTSLLYKERMEKRCSDLQKAEAEVDALGDEVETLLSLLEKVYVALDHYSPILQHYPGITEILKLVKRELSGETVKGSRSPLI
ncbi:hypothetical protein KSS87_009342 [Heliosperma pusillum]|nr:hypothetical protein KSS87_009342 [Heliosperma pusillum]